MADACGMGCVEDVHSFRCRKESVARQRLLPWGTGNEGGRKGIAGEGNIATSAGNK